MPNGLDRFILGFDLANSPPRFFSPHFQLRHPVLAPPSGVETKLNVGAQLQTFPYPTISKPLVPTASGRSRSYKLYSSKSVTDQQTDKNRRFCTPSVQRVTPAGRKTAESLPPTVLAVKKLNIFGSPGGVHLFLT